MAESRNSLLEVTWETLKENGRLLTVFAVAAIVIGGLTLVQSPENWWIALLAVTGFFFALFLFLNARVVVKSILSLVVTITLSAFAFNIAIVEEPFGSASILWFFGHFVVFFFGLSVSYFLPSGQSRWTTMGLSVFIYFAITWFLASITQTLFLPAILSTVIAGSVFVLMYLFGSKSRFSSKKMPQNGNTEALSSNIQKAAQFSDLNSHYFKSDDPSYLVWNERAYVLYPVILDQAFGVIGKRNKAQLSYKGKAINSWLRFLSFTKNPYFKSRGAETMLILVDIKNANGNEFKTIGVSSPDSKAVIPVGVMPGRLLLANEDKALKKALARLDVTYQEYVTDLTEKQKVALSKLGETKQEKENVS